MKNLKLMFLIIGTLFFTTNLIAKNNIALSDSVDLNDYVGKFKYQTGPVEFLNFALKGGVLIAFAEGYPETVLSMKAKDVFEDNVYGAVFKFSRTDKKVTKVNLEVNGAELIATKVEAEKN